MNEWGGRNVTPYKISRSEVSHVFFYIKYLLLCMCEKRSKKSTYGKKISKNPPPPLQAPMFRY